MTTTNKKIVKKASSTAVAVLPTEGQMQELKNRFPVDQGITRIQIPRLGMFSQDKTEEVRNPVTKKKEIQVISEAGTFYTDKETDKETDEGKKIWAKEEIGSEIEGIIIYQRKQLSFYDESAEKYTTSPVYDSETETIPLFRDKVEVDRGTPAELKARKEYQTVKNGKKKSALEDNRILYVIYDEKIYQMNLRGSSMYSFMTYSRKTTVPAVLTTFNSQQMKKGDIEWNQMTFEVSRVLGKDEVANVLKEIDGVEEAISQEKAFYANMATAKSDEGESDLDKF